MIMARRPAAAGRCGAENFGMAMGPFRMSDLAGLDIGWASRKRRAERDPGPELFERGGPIVRGAVASARRPRPAGTVMKPGYARPDSGSPGVTTLIDKYRAQKGITPRQVTTRRSSSAASMRSSTRGAHHRGRHRSARSDIDFVYLNGYGFPLYRGGPMFYADQVGLDDVARRMLSACRHARRRPRLLDAGAAARAPRR